MTYHHIESISQLKNRERSTLCQYERAFWQITNPLYIYQLSFSVSHILQARMAHLLSMGELGARPVD